MQETTTPTGAGPAEPRERELKLDARPQDMRRLSGRLGRLAGSKRRGPTARLVSVYFDTEAQDLRAAGVALRIRRIGRRRVQTLKHEEGGAGLFDRAEFERPVRAATPALDAEEVAALAGWLPAPLGEDRPLGPLFTTIVQRTLFDIVRGEVFVEAALDRCEVVAGEAREAFCELELELRAGEPADLYAIARELSANVPLRLGVVAKSARGYALLSGEAGKAVKAKASPLVPGMTVGEACQAVLWAGLAQYRVNEDLLLSAPEPKAVHQARVALRRLRSAFSLFKPTLGEGEAQTLRDRLKALAGRLGGARDIDVLVKRQQKDTSAPALPEELVALLEARRSQAYEEGLAAIRSDEAAALAIDLSQWASAGDWLAIPEAAAPVEGFAAAALEKRRKRLKKAGKNLGGLDVEARHQARIEAKKLRYACDFFGGLYSKGKPAKRFAAFRAELVALQKSLGELNDIAAAADLTLDLAREAGGEGAGEAAYAAGRIAGRASAAEGPLLAAAVESFEALMDARRFWD